MNTLVRGTDESGLAKGRLLSLPREPLFFARWDSAVFIHYEVDPAKLQRCIPFELDLLDGRAFVSVVAFSMRRMRPRFGGMWSELLLRPIASHEFLNVRTYVRHDDEPGIFFMAEWLSNRLSAFLGPATFGLPYHYGKIAYRHQPATRDLTGLVRASEGSLSYRAAAPLAGLEVCDAGSADEFLLERYTAFTGTRRRRKFFRVWHEPWPQARIKVEVMTDDLLGATGDWISTASVAFANYSPGVDVWMGWPHFIDA